MSFTAAENDRRAANAVMIGTVTSVNAGAATARVAFGGLTSPDLPVGQMRAGALSFWWMPSVGEQVVVACPSGDVGSGVIIAAIFAGNAPSGNADVPRIELGGGTMEVGGSLIVSGDVIAGGISLINHKHGGVQTGGSKTGVPT